MSALVCKSELMELVASAVTSIYIIASQMMEVGDLMEISTGFWFWFKEWFFVFGQSTVL